MRSILQIAILIKGNLYISAFRRMKPKKKRKNYDKNNLEMAVEVVKSGQMTAYKAALAFGVPSRTIYFRLNRYKTPIEAKNSNQDI